jgi:hypothetical protein
MNGLRPTVRRGSFLAASLALAAGMACGRGQVPAAEYDPDAPVQETPAPAPPAAAAAPAAPGAAPAAPQLTPEEDSAQEARAFARRQQSMESYESCMAKTNSIEEEQVRATLREACARSRRPKP